MYGHIYLLAHGFIIVAISWPPASPHDLHPRAASNHTAHQIAVTASGQVQRGEGLIINMGSMAAVRPTPAQCAYSTCKWGLRGWSLGCQEVLSQHGVKVVLINPGARALEKKMYSTLVLMHAAVTGRHLWNAQALIDKL